MLTEIMKAYIFFNWDSLHAELNSHYTELQEKEVQKDQSIQKIPLARIYR